MAARDKFGFKNDNIRSKTAAMAARPQGVTMGEIEDQIGRTNYNAFRDAEKWGHTVIRNGRGRSMRIWLIHRDEEVPDELQRTAGQLAEDELEDGEIQEELDDANAEPRGLTFALESDFQARLRANLEQLEPGLKEIDSGREHNYRDITAHDRDGNVVVIELKAGSARQNAVAQILGYMGEAKSEMSEPNAKVRGILVASDFQEKVYSAASV